MAGTSRWWAATRFWWLLWVSQVRLFVDSSCGAVCGLGCRWLGWCEDGEAV